MSLARYVMYFVTGGIVTTTIIALEEFGAPLLSRLAALFPIFTWVAYLFIAQFGTAQQVSAHAKFVLIGTLVSWTPYMLAIIYLAPRIGVHKAIAAAIGIFVVVALVFSYVYFKV